MTTKDILNQMEKEGVAIKNPVNKKKIKDVDREFYQSVHYWLRFKYGRANKCEGKDCTGTSSKFNWALKKGKKYEYKRENFIHLCRSCHAKYDCSEITRKKCRDHSRFTQKTHCMYGHPFSGENLYLIKGKWRGCKKCLNRANRKFYAKMKLENEQRLKVKEIISSIGK